MHGTNSEYIHKKCRCDKCKAAHREYENERRRKGRREKYLPVIEFAMKTLGSKCAYCGAREDEDNPLYFCAKDRSKPHGAGLSGGRSVRDVIYHDASWFEVADRLAESELVCGWCRQKRVEGK